LARGWRRPLVCSDPIVERARGLAAEVSGAALESNVEVARRCDLLVLAHKPSQLNEVAGEVRDDARAIASILAVTPLQALREAFPARPDSRFLPSLPFDVRQGAHPHAVDGGEDSAGASGTGVRSALDA